MSIISGQFNLITDFWNWNSANLPYKDAVIHWTAGQTPFRWTYYNIYMRAEYYAAYIRHCGISKGEVCALIIKHNKEFYPLYMGIVLAGAIPAVLAYPNPRLHPDKFKEGIQGMSQRSGLDWILTEPDAGNVLTTLIKNKQTTIKGIKYPFEDDYKEQEYNYSSPESLSGSSPLLLQHSSGTTGLQKPVLLSHQAVMNHLSAYAEAIKLSVQDKIVSWLPLYHDMGLIAAFHLPLALGVPLVQIDPFEWITVPSLLPQIVSSELGTITWLPNFAFNVLADKVRDDDLQNVSLSSWRLIINCSEPVRYESHQKFFNRYSKYGLKADAISSSYATAETTFAVTQTPPGEEIKSVQVNEEEFRKGNILRDTKGGRIFLSSGIPVKGCSIRIVNESREDVPEETIGELAVTSEALFEGYRNYPEKTSEVLEDGLFYTGDLGFKSDNYYFITGRKKDLIIVAGNNIYPEDVEAAVSNVSGIIPGRVIAAGEYDSELGSEQVSVIAESEITGNDALKKLKSEIVKAGMAIDITIKNIYLVPPRWLIKSSAGKPGRKINMERIKKEHDLRKT